MDFDIDGCDAAKGGRKRKRQSSQGTIDKRRKYSIGHDDMITISAPLPPYDPYASLRTYLAIRDADMVKILAKCRFSAAAQNAAFGGLIATGSAAVRMNNRIAMFTVGDCVAWGGSNEKNVPVLRCSYKDGGTTTSLRLAPQLVIFFHFTLMGCFGAELAEALEAFVCAHQRSLKTGLPVDECVIQTLTASLPLWLLHLRRPKMRCSDRNNCVNYMHAC